jgi:streptomycin 6-kinase
LLDAQSPPVPLHGDLHHDNILRAESVWVAIDPKGLLGDPAYDYANSFQNPERAERLVQDPERIARHAGILAKISGIDRRNLLGWAAAHAVLSGGWHVEDGNSPAFQERMLALLLPAYWAD